MITLSLPIRFVLLSFGTLLAAGSSTSASPTLDSAFHGAARSSDASSQSGARRSALRGPALIAADGKGGLEYWPIDPKGSHHPQDLADHLGVSQAIGLAGDGQRIAMANGDEVVVYDLRSGVETVLPDPYGYPTDIAIDKSGGLYVPTIMGSAASIAWYPTLSSRPRQLTCPFLDNPIAIAIDNEGDIFTNQNGESYEGVIEIPNPRGAGGPQNCFKLHLKGNPGYEGGLAIDPKTDDLIVLDDPDLCAGGLEGRMTIYPPPYHRDTGVSHNLGANCAGTIRLDATSSIVFVGDETVSGGRGYILQRTYPDGKPLGTYSGGRAAGFTTIPNTLPN